MTWAIRRASPSDRGALEELCRASVGPDDYVIEHLDWELRNSVVHVASDAAGRIVGMAVHRTCIDGSGWLAMARTLPDVRRQGVNRAIAGSFVEMDRAAGVSVIRLWTNATNEAGQATFAQLGFREVARFTRMEAPSRRGDLRSEPRGPSEDLWRQVEDSPFVLAGNRYVAHGWQFVPANRATVSAIARSGGMRGWGDQVLSIADQRRPQENQAQEFTVWSGDLEELLAEGRRLAANAGRDRAGVYVPWASDLVDRAARAGYQVVDWGGEAILCELAIPVGPTGSARAGRTRSSGPCS